MNKRKLVSFDWAMKKILRGKAHFEILEGFLSELLKEPIVIIEVLESESNQEYQNQKFNRVDLKVRNEQAELLIIEIQYDREFDYLQRIYLATCRAATEHLRQGQPYSEITKVISINILYFDLGHGDDYLYHGTTRFRGIHTNDELRLSAKQQELFGKEYPYQLYPEYYLIKINQFNDIARDGLDQWIYFFKYEEVLDEFNAQGLAQAKATLDILSLADDERIAYERYAEDLRYQASMFASSYGDGFRVGKQAGEAIGIQKGEAIGIQKGEVIGIQKGEVIGIQKGEAIGIQKGEINKARLIAMNLLNIMDDNNIANVTGLSVDEISQLRKHSTDC